MRASGRDGLLKELLRISKSKGYSEFQMPPRCFSEGMSARLGVVRGGLLRFGVGYFGGVRKV